jgi:hypothetical protein
MNKIVNKNLKSPNFFYFVVFIKLTRLLNKQEQIVFVKCSFFDVLNSKFTS